MQRDRDKVILLCLCTLNSIVLLFRIILPLLMPNWKEQLAYLLQEQFSINTMEDLADLWYPPAILLALWIINDLLLVHWGMKHIRAHMQNSMWLEVFIVIWTVGFIWATFGVWIESTGVLEREFMLEVLT